MSYNTRLPTMNFRFSIFTMNTPQDEKHRYQPLAAGAVSFSLRVRDGSLLIRP